VRCFAYIIEMSLISEDPNNELYLLMPHEILDENDNTLCLPSALHIACYYGSNEIVKILIARAKNQRIINFREYINHKDMSQFATKIGLEGTGNTALHYSAVHAVTTGNFVPLNILLFNEADLYAKNSE